jgi:hypothetical protein
MFDWQEVDFEFQYYSSLQGIPTVMSFNFIRPSIVNKTDVNRKDAIDSCE